MHRAAWRYDHYASEPHQEEDFEAWLKVVVGTSDEDYYQSIRMKNWSAINEQIMETWVVLEKVAARHGVDVPLDCTFDASLDFPR